MTNTNDADWQADWAIEIDRGRLALDGSLVDAINALTRAQQALATLTSESSLEPIGSDSEPSALTPTLALVLLLRSA